MKILKTLLVISIVFGILVLSFACKKKTSDPEPEPKGVKVSDITKVMDLETRAAIMSIETSDFTFVFSETDVVVNMAIGDILKDSASEFARYGYLRKITSIDDAKGEIVVYTEPAGLTEAALQGSIDFNSGNICSP